MQAISRQAGVFPGVALGHVSRKRVYPETVSKQAVTSTRFGSKPDNLGSEMLEIKAHSGRTLTMRRWWPISQKESTKTMKGPAVLIVPGLGVRTEWASPMVARLIDNHPLAYGLDTNVLGPNPSERGHLGDRRELVKELQDAVEWITEKHGGPVYLTGISLGALAITHLLAEEPEKVAGAVLVAPAYRPAPASFKPWFYVKMFLRLGLSKIGLASSAPVKMPYEDDSVLADPSQVSLEFKNQVSSLTIPSFWQLLKMTVCESMDKAKKVKTPVLVVVPGKDTVCSPESMVKGYRLMPSKDKELITFPNAHHSIVLEAEMVPLAKKIDQWLQARQGRGGHIA